jgi:hypothetical protein
VRQPLSLVGIGYAVNHEDEGGLTERPQEQLLCMQFANLGMDEHLAVADESADLVPWPRVPEKIAFSQEEFCDLGETGISWIFSGFCPKGSDRLSALGLPVAQHRADAGTSQHDDKRIPAHQGEGVGVDEQRRVGFVPGDEVACRPDEAGGRRHLVVDQINQVRVQLTTGYGRLWLVHRQAGKAPGVAPPDFVKLQGTGKRVENLACRVDVSPLLKPGVPGQADRREVSDLAAPQTDHAPAPCDRQANVLRLQRSSPRSQEIGQLAAANDIPAAGSYPAHDPQVTSVKQRRP